MDDKPRMLAKDGDSGRDGCPAIYVHHGRAIVQGQQTSTDGLENVLPGETAVTINPQVILDTADQLRAEGW